MSDVVVGLTPMMKQYLEIKSQHQDALLMFRLGDFYELFFDDAVTASKVLEITLTGRDAGTQGRVPMCGVPYHAAEQYVSRLIDRGFAVAICEQVEDPKQTKGLVKREVVKVITPGTLLREEGQGSRLLLGVVFRQQQYGAAVLDISTGEVSCSELNSVSALDELLNQWQPSEILLYEDSKEADAFASVVRFGERTSVRISDRKAPRHAQEVATDTVLQHYGLPNLIPLDLDQSPVAAEALGFVLSYIHETQRMVLAHIKPPRVLDRQLGLFVDYTASKNLELLETQRTRKKQGSLYGLLDVTRTSLGSRRLRRYIEQPLQSAEEIEDRLDAVTSFNEGLFARDQVQTLLDDVYDLERLIGKVSFGSASPRDLRAISQSLGHLPELKQVLGAITDAGLLGTLGRTIPDALYQLACDIDNFLVDQPPTGVRDGGFIRVGADAQLDEMREVNSAGKEWLSQLEVREKERTGIRSLKVGYNKVFGYYIEVSKANAHLVPSDYERKQTLASAERYSISELRDREQQILHAEERALEREMELFHHLRQQVMSQLQSIQAAAEVISEVDALCALGQVAAEQHWVRPAITSERGVSIEQGRHPMVEAANPGEFVPNDVRLDRDHQLILITGPNMAGKSTYMRQTALIVILAHMGSYVPAVTAKIGLIDRIFTRIGASDDLGAGQSTFMVEMVELAQILRQSTSRSLVLLDEIGRGTSTYDGMSIAEAVMEALLTPSRSPLTLFATHYHELTDKVSVLQSADNYSVLVQETDAGIAFMHSVVNRPADQSYGIQVAKLAGIPTAVIERAQDLLWSREKVANQSETVVSSGLAESAVGIEAESQQSSLSLHGYAYAQLVEQIADTDVNQLTPVAALVKLNELITAAKEVRKWEISE